MSEIKTGPNSVFHRARKLQREGKLEEAVVAYNQILETSTKSAWTYSNLGETLAKLGNLDNAINSYRQAIELNPNRSWFYYQLGTLLLRKGELSAAASSLGKAIEIRPKKHFLYHQLGEVLEKQGKLDAALGYWQKAIELNSKSSASYHKIAEFFFIQQQWEKAVENYRQALNINPNLFLSYFGLGKALQRQGEYSEAIACYQRASELHPGNAEVYHWLGEVFLKVGRLCEAINSYQKAIDIQPKAWFYRGLADALRIQGKDNEAIAYYEQAIQLKLNDTFLYEKLKISLITEAKNLVAKVAYLENNSEVKKDLVNALPYKSYKSHHSLQPVQSLWIGDKLGIREQLSIMSFLRNGHQFELWTYNTVQNVPEGTRVLDASKIMPKTVVDSCDSRWCSDAFRYKMLFERGGYWVDLDVVCLRPFDFGIEYLFTLQHNWGYLNKHIVVGNVIKAPKGSTLMQELYDFCLEYLPKEKYFGQVGPELLTRKLIYENNSHYTRFIAPAQLFNNIDWQEVQLFLTANSQSWERLKHPDVYAVHLWSKMWHNLDQDSTNVPEGNIYRRLQDQFLKENYLTELANQFGSDKGSKFPNRHHYTKYYHIHFFNLFYRQINLMEIGLCRKQIGGEPKPQNQIPSLEMWLRYFPNSNIIGVDIADFSWVKHPRVKTFQADQGSRSDWSRVLQKLEKLGKNSLDIIIDDGSHASQDQQITLGLLLPYLRPGGIYVIEDLDWQPPEREKKNCPKTKELLLNFKETANFDSPVLTDRENQYIEKQVVKIQFYNSEFEEKTKKLSDGICFLFKSSENDISSESKASKDDDNEYFTADNFKQLMSITNPYSYVDSLDSKTHYLPPVTAIGYQIREWEYINYHVYKMPNTDTYFRGPQKQLANRQYICFVGAAQTFGCFCDRPFSSLVEKSLGITSLNLGIGGAGPKQFLNVNLIDLINKSALCVLQILSSRSIESSLWENLEGNVHYTYLETGNRHFMDNVWKNLLNKYSNSRIIQIVDECRQNWLNHYNQLFEMINVPIILLYISETKPTDDNNNLTQKRLDKFLGKFPQLVTNNMISSIKKNAIHYIEYVKSDREPTILSKKSKPNETVKDIYYPSQKMHYEITEILVKWLKNNDQIISKDNKATTKSNSSIAVGEKNTNSLCCSKTRSDKLFVVIVALPRSGSTLVMRLLNRMPNTNIFGENFGALKKLYQFQKSLEKTLEWPDKGYYIPLSRQELA